MEKVKAFDYHDNETTEVIRCHIHHYDDTGSRTRITGGCIPSNYDGACTCNGLCENVGEAHSSPWSVSQTALISLNEREMNQLLEHGNVRIQGWVGCTIVTLDMIRVNPLSQAPDELLGST